MRSEQSTPGLEKKATETTPAAHDDHGSEGARAPSPHGCQAVCWVTCRIHPQQLSRRLRRPGRKVEPRGAWICPESHTAPGHWRGRGHTRQTRTPHGMGTVSLLGSEVLNHRHRSDPADNKAYSTSLQTINKIDSTERERQISTGIETTGDEGRIKERERTNATKDAQTRELHRERHCGKAPIQKQRQPVTHKSKRQCR